MVYSSYFHLVVGILLTSLSLFFFFYSPSGSSSHFELHFLVVVWGIACSGEREQLSAACSGTELSGLGFLNGGELSHQCHINPCCATRLQTGDIVGLPEACERSERQWIVLNGCAPRNEINCRDLLAIMPLQISAPSVFAMEIEFKIM